MIQKHGADAVRLHMLHKAHPNDVLEWEDTSIVGIHRWLTRMNSLVTSVVRYKNDRKLSETIPDVKETQTLTVVLNKAIKDMVIIFEKTHAFNTAVSTLIKLTAAIEKFSKADPNVRLLAVESLVKMVAPMAPAHAEEYWLELNGESCQSVLEQNWPELFDVAPQDNLSSMKCTVQVNGKVRWICHLEPDLNESDLLSNLRKLADWDKWIGSKPVKRVFIVKNGAVVNLVV